jgi:hypothetical protein
MPLAPLHARVVLEKGQGETLNPKYYTWVGLYGKVYRMDFLGLMSFIRMRNGHQRKRLEYKPQ